MKQTQTFLTEVANVKYTDANSIDLKARVVWAMDFDLNLNGLESIKISILSIYIIDNGTERQIKVPNGFNPNVDYCIGNKKPLKPTKLVITKLDNTIQIIF